MNRNEILSTGTVITAAHAVEGDIVSRDFGKGLYVVTGVRGDWIYARSYGNMSNAALATRINREGDATVVKY